MSLQYGELRPLAAEMSSSVWGTPANFNGFRVLAALLHGVSQTLRRWTEGATYIGQGGHHVGIGPHSSYRLLSTCIKYVFMLLIKDRVPSKELRERLGIGDIILILQQNRLLLYGHMLRKEDTDWMKKCVEYEVEGPKPRGTRRPASADRTVYQRGHGQRLCKKIAKHAIWTGRMLRIVVDGRSW